MDGNSSDQEDVIEDGSTTPWKAVSLAGKKQEKTCASITGTTTPSHALICHAFL
jgi:hypothetical protein